MAAPRVVQPPYAPERNPVERFFQELRRALEGRVCPDLQAKQAALEPILNVWLADPERVKQLCRWGWIRDRGAGHCFNLVDIGCGPSGARS